MELLKASSQIFLLVGEGCRAGGYRRLAHCACPSASKSETETETETENRTDIEGRYWIENDRLMLERL